MSHKVITGSSYEKWGAQKLMQEHALAVSRGTPYALQRASAMASVYHKKYGVALSSPHTSSGKIHSEFKTRMIQRHGRRGYQAKRREIYLLVAGKHMTYKEIAEHYHTSISVIKHIYNSYLSNRHKRGKGAKHSKPHHVRKYKKIGKRAPVVHHMMGPKLVEGVEPVRFTHHRRKHVSMVGRPMSGTKTRIGHIKPPKPKY